MNAQIALLIAAFVPALALAQRVDMATYGNGAPIAEVNSVAEIRAKLANSCRQSQECMKYFVVDGTEVKQIRARPTVPTQTTPQMKAALRETGASTAKP